MFCTIPRWLRRMKAAGGKRCINHAPRKARGTLHFQISTFKFQLFWFFALFCAPLQAQVKVAALHPLLTEMCAAVGGEAVETAALYPANMELHEFAPDTAAVGAAAGCSLVLALGKGTEPYLHDLQESLPEQTRILPLGDALPDVMVPESAHRDPHWWNSPAAMRRAARVLRDALTAAAPADRAAFEQGYKTYAAQMEELEREARLAFAALPADHRVLVTEHAALCHFCALFHFTPLAVQGVAQESEGDTATMAHLLTELRRRHVPCLFTEAYESPRAMQSLAQEVGAATRPLVLDGVSPTLQGYAAISVSTFNKSRRA